MKKGFTLIELVMVLSIMAIVSGIALPAYVSMRDEGNYTKAQKEMPMLQSSVEKYWMQNGALPKTLQDSVVSNKLLAKQMQDPWKTDGKNYGYNTGKASTGEDFYVIYTKGLGDKAGYTVSGDRIVNSGKNIIVSNLPVVED
jgi:prepilin-type N-terminal cleavage/methylation domain-containing protein